MAHDHSKEVSNNLANSDSKRDLFVSVWLNAFITLVEVLAGFYSNSLALLSDAAHNLSDTISLFIAWVAGRIGEREANQRKTFGFRRAEILAALANAIILVGVCIYILLEAIERMQDPQPIRSILMMAAAASGLLVNFIAVILLNRHKQKSINIKAAYLHLLGDTISSVAVLAGGIVIYFYKWYWLDPVLSILVSIYILKEAWVILIQAVDILMQSTPQGMDIEKIKSLLEKMEGISNIHHVHAWNLSDKETHFECHIDLNKDYRLSEAREIQIRIEKVLQEQFGIQHITLQFEYDSCADKRIVNH